VNGTNDDKTCDQQIAALCDYGIETISSYQNNSTRENRSIIQMTAISSFGEKRFFQLLAPVTASSLSNLNGKHSTIHHVFIVRLWCRDSQSWCSAETSNSDM